MPTIPGPGTGRFAVNGTLTSRRSVRVVENDDFARFARRILAAHGRRIATGDVEGLRDLAALADALHDATDTAVRGLREAGFSWAEIGDRLGITRQAAHQRWGSLPAAGSPAPASQERTAS